MKIPLVDLCAFYVRCYILNTIYKNMNEQVFNFLYGLAYRSIIIDLLTVLFAKFSIYILILVALGMIFAQKDFKHRYYFLSLTVLSVILSSGIVKPIVNYFFYNPRPFVVLANVKTLISHSASASMPSGHMMFIVPIALAVFYMNRKAGLWFFGAVILMGVSRVIAGVHWPLDILAGILLGALSFYAAKLLLDAKYKL